MARTWPRRIPHASRPLVVLWLALAIFAGALGHPGLTLAQGAIHLSGIEVTSRFPDGILFTLSVAGSQDIVAITLRYRVIGERVERLDRLGFAEAPDVEAEFLLRTDTADRYIPPGAELEYRFEIEDAAGDRVETEPQRFVLLDPRFSWRRLDGLGGYILYHGGERDLAQRVLDGALVTLRDMGKLMGVTVEEPLRITLYNSWTDMRVALPPRSQVQEASLVSEGVSFGETGVILVLGSARNAVGVTSHETAHFLMQQAIGPMAPLVPAWLNEGLAEHANPVPSGSYTSALQRAIRDGGLIPLSSLTRPPGRPEDVILFYGEAESVVAYMVESYGEQLLQRLLQELREGTPIDDALMASYRLDRDTLEARWRQSIGARPRAAGADRRSLPTPLPRPTLVPFGAAASRPTAPTSTPVAPSDVSGCGRLEVLAGARRPVDLAGVAPSLGLVALLGLLHAARRGRGDGEATAAAQEDADDLAAHREALAEEGDNVEAAEFFREIGNDDARERGDA